MITKYVFLLLYAWQKNYLIDMTLFGNEAKIIEKMIKISIKYETSYVSLLKYVFFTSSIFWLTKPVLRKFYSFTSDDDVTVFKYNIHHYDEICFILYNIVEKK